MKGVGKQLMIVSSQNTEKKYNLVQLKLTYGAI